MYRLVEYRDDSSHISGGARSYRKSRHRKSRDQKLPWPEMTSPEVTVPALFSYYSSSTKCTIAHSEKTGPYRRPQILLRFPWYIYITERHYHWTCDIVFTVTSSMNNALRKAYK